MAEYENGAYCNFDSSTTKAVAGKDIILSVFDATGTNLLAISGQKGLTINRSADSIEVTAKDTQGGWKSKIAGMKEWSVDNDGFYIPSHASHKALGTAFQNSDPVCIKIVNGKTKKSMFGGLAYVTDYSFEAPYDDGMTYSISLEGNGALVDFSLTSDSGATQMPQGMEEEQKNK